MATVLLVGGCGSAVPGPSTGDSVAIQPVIMNDAPPGQLDSHVYIDLGGYDAATRDRALIDIGFTSGGRPVKFAGGQQLKCNGSSTNLFTGSFELSLSAPAVAGTSMTCLYTNGQESTPLTFRVPVGPVFLSPREHDIVPRSALTTVTYKTEPSSWLTVVAFGGPPDMKASARPEATTATQATLDTTALHPGSGPIWLAEEFAPLVVTGPLFRSVAGGAHAISMVEVTWT
jgi:hypothetical protein